jgi:chitodextrinase
MRSCAAPRLRRYRDHRHRSRRRVRRDPTSGPGRGSTSSSPDGSIVKYLWEFGDGATANGPHATHTYTEAGTYLVTLAVQDNRRHWNVTSAPSEVHVK